MNEQERKKFICELIENVKGKLLLELSKYPNEWNGLEIRERIGELFNRERVKMTLKRKREYNNFCITELP